MKETKERKKLELSIRKANREKNKDIDITKPHLRQFFKCVEIGPEPALTHGGYWKKPNFDNGFEKPKSND